MTFRTPLHESHQCKDCGAVITIPYAAASPEPLDVDRLARAMRPVKRRRDLHYRDGTVGGFREEYEQPTPEEVARAYAEDRGR